MRASPWITEDFGIMQNYQKKFIEFALQTGVLRFGEFVLKSGRTSPYFFNSGLFNTGDSLAKLGQFYAHALANSKIEYDMIFGPAYKGIPLVAALGVALSTEYNADIPYAFNRKEAKDHGEGGNIVGAELTGRVLIVDDVISAGTSVRESIDLIESVGAEPAGVLIALDRQEKGQNELSAIQEIENDLNLKVASIVQLQSLLSFLQDKPEMIDHLDAVKNYRSQYGVIADSR